MSTPPPTPRRVYRQPRRRRGPVVLVVVALVLGVIGGAAVWAWEQRQPEEIIGNATQEFIEDAPAAAPTTAATPVTTAAVDEPAPRENWPMYRFDPQRTGWNPNLAHRPPYDVIWSHGAKSLLEFPPAVADDRLFFANIRGVFVGLNARNGQRLWAQETGRCSASSPTIDGDVVYAAFMDPYPCPKAQTGTGFIIAWDTATGRELWRTDMGAVESSPLVMEGRVYVADWNDRMHALDQATGEILWSSPLDGKTVSSAAWVPPAMNDGRAAVVIGTEGGTLYLFDAVSGAEIWALRVSGSEYYYATPVVAYGRIYVGQTNGYMYAVGARSGEVIWAQRAGSYIYSAAVAAEKVIYVGTYDGYLIAYDAATGAEQWRTETPGAVHGAMTLMDGLIYYSICARCGQTAARPVKSGERGTHAVDITTREIVWSFPEGYYSPITADERRVYLTGYGRVFALRPTGG